MDTSGRAWSGRRARRVWRAAVTALASGAVVLAGAAPAAASPSSTSSGTAKVDCVAFAADGTCEVAGVVYAITQVGDRTYIGGDFASVGGVSRANVAALRGDGTLDPTWDPSTDGTVYALAASADGSRIFVGGGFTTVGGQPRSRLAAVTADTGVLVPGFAAEPKNNLVRALAADAGDRLYVGGSYTRIAGQPVERLAAVSQTTGELLPGFDAAAGDTVRGLALSADGSRLYAGGPFQSIGGAARPGSAELDPLTGRATSFAPTEGGVVIAVDVTPSGRAYFATMNNRTWAYDPAVRNTPVYVVRTSGDVQAILATDDEVYVGGHFSGFPEVKQSRLHIGSFRTANGAVTAWNPGANGTYGVWALELTRTRLSPDAAPAVSVGGDFSRSAGAARRGYARFLF